MHWSKRDYAEPDGYQIAVQKIFQLYASISDLHCQHSGITANI